MYSPVLHDLHQTVLIEGSRSGTPQRAMIQQIIDVEEEEEFNINKKHRLLKEVNKSGTSKLTEEKRQNND